MNNPSSPPSIRPCAKRRKNVIKVRAVVAFKAAMARRKTTVGLLHRHEQLNTIGSVHFVTTVTRVRGAWFVDGELCGGLLRIWERYRLRTGVSCLGYCLMPDHMHVLLFQPKADGAVYRLINQFKGYSSRYLRPAGFPGVTLWRIDYDDVPVPGLDAVATKLHYMHANPVRSGLVESDVDYPWSSARFYARAESSIVELCPLDAMGAISVHNQ